MVKLFFALYITLFLISCNNKLDESIPQLKTLAVTSDLGVFYPEFNSQVKHYAASCGDMDEFLITASAENPKTQIYINDVLFNTDNNIAQSFQGYSYDTDIAVEVRNGKAIETYFIHCISKDFPQIETVTYGSGPYEGFILVAPRVSINTVANTLLLILDNNGVPHFRRFIEGSATNFQRHFNGYYSYASPIIRNEFNQRDNEIVILNSKFEQIDSVTTVDLNHTDNHDFLITPNLTYMLLSYNSIYRDFTPYGLSNNELTRDSVIQELTKDGELIFEWNSWDHLDINDCKNHRFPDDYAHINSIQLAPDGNIIASFRGCSQITKIDRITGEAIWDLGGFTPSLQIDGDRYKEFCGQHTATEDNMGNLFVFDNGGHCNGNRELVDGQFSRAVQYHLDIDSSKATFIRDYSLNNTYSQYTRSQGSIYSTLNGDWIINWGSGPDVSITEINSEGEKVLDIWMTKDGKILTNYRAYREIDIEIPLNLIN